MKRSGLTWAALALLLVAIIAVSSVAVMATWTGGASKTTASQQTSLSSSTSTSAEDGLLLSLSVSPSETYSGSPITVRISDFNTLTVTNAPATTGVPTVGNTTLSLGSCSQLPLGFAIYEGNYQASNLSEGSALDVYQPGIYNCPAIFPIAYFSFSPLSDNVSLYSPQPSGSGSSTVPTEMWTVPDAFSQGFSGYWTGGSGGLKSGTFHAFAPGVYTLVGGDDFGQITLVHFQVQSPQTTVTSTTGQSSSSVSTTTAPPGGENASADSLYGLRLLVNMNATEIIPGEAVQVNLTEFNTLPKVNDISVSGDWPVQVSLGSCKNIYDQPFGIAVYAGHVNGQNLSQGQQLDIFPIVACPMYIRLVTGYEFQPQSNLAVILPGLGATPSPLVGSVVVRISYSSQTQSLPPGTYTVVAADEWGALAFLYFQVR